ncbi:glutathione transferase [Zwartia sp.]|uniref:glutathione transferase n=1 Tax=Zwartia sp. TaxID=2978004 RepID=UPI00271CEC9D|nr:glutathione transferase [Zwartia sp.]MDO9024293.1 glutathione transferase [Zwartia sp.]
MRLYVDSKFTSPYAMSVFVCLRAKGLDFELKTIDLDAKQNLSNDYLRSSVTSRVPAFIDGQFSLSESSAIAEYLEEIKPNPNLYPNNVQDRAKARQIQAWLRSDLLALREERSTEVIFYKPVFAELSGAGKVAAQKLIQVASLLLDDGRMNLFESWSIADTDLALMLNRLIFNGDSVPESLKNYAKFQWQHPAIMEWMELKRPLKNA